VSTLRISNSAARWESITNLSKRGEGDYLELQLKDSGRGEKGKDAQRATAGEPGGRPA